MTDNQINTVREALEECIAYIQATDAVNPMESLARGEGYSIEAQPLVDKICKSIAALSALDPEAIRRDIEGSLSELEYAIERLEKVHDDKCCYGHEAIKRIRSSILSAEPAQDDGKPEVGDIVAWDKEGLNVEAYKHPRREIVRRPVVLMRFAEVKRRLEEAEK